MSNICIIPARGGSKRIPRKNIKNFYGRPIIAYAIKVAIDSKIFDDVIVSTDDEEIKKIAINHGASVPFMRSKKNSNDQASTFDVLKEVIEWLESCDHKISLICCLYPCSPLLKSNDLLKAYNAFKKNKVDSLIPIINYSHPIHRALSLDNNKNLSMLDKKSYLIRTQDFQEVFYDAGQFYFYKTDLIKNFNSPFESSVMGYKLNPLYAQDIDNELDWKIAELKYKILNEIS